MNLLFVARTGVFEALAVGMAYLDQEEQLESSPFFGDMAKEKSGELMFLGTSNRGQDIYCAGNDYPDIVVRINEKLKSLAGEVDSPLKVIPLGVPGGESIYPLSRLAMLPLAGGYFSSQARAETLAMKEQLVSIGKALQKENREAGMAAKPLPE